MLRLSYFIGDRDFKLIEQGQAALVLTHRLPT